MQEEFRAALTAELSSLRPPPGVDLVAVSLRAGRRRRRVRRLYTGLGALTVAVLVGAVLAVPGLVASRPAGRTAGPGVTGTASGPAIPPTASLPASDSTAHRTAATPAGVLELLTSLLPPGTVGNAARGSGDQLSVQVYLDRGQGPGMIRLKLATGDGTELCSNLDCETGPGGVRIAVATPKGNCVQRTSVYALHPDGTQVQLSIADCLAWNGQTNPPGSVALSQDEARAIVADPRWGLAMDPALTIAGQRRFPDLPVIR